ncbi:YomR-like protein [Bacillus phage Shbh1]|uniref:YomR-like protein n=1 Tax=Bacillus phage Shbh1 TaxID=1796992 RepID=A0A142F1G1_9CAUD|nr:YomR-like protein [Bacillus phage Shbh1]AMQ66618.1 YomR-like protein [Bacillus phage Shbh1]
MSSQLKKVNYGDPFLEYTNTINDMVDFLSEYENEMEDHLNDTDNPHEVTKQQIGLENVDNVLQASKEEFDQLQNTVNGQQDLINYLTEEVDSKAPKTSLDSLENSINSVINGLNLKANSEDLNSLEALVSQHSLDISSIVSELDTKADTISVSSLSNDLVSHTENTSNPHNVTKQQIGLGDVENVLQASKQEFDDHVEDYEQFKASISGAMEGDFSEMYEELQHHKQNKSNPHQVTKTQIGLGEVENVLQASKQEFDSHLGDTSNPHGVTKQQVGLGNVSNVLQASNEDFQAHVIDYGQFKLSTENDLNNFDQHLQNSNNPHNVTSSQVNVLPENAFTMDSSPSDYPIGITSFMVTGTGWSIPLAVSNVSGTVVTTRLNNIRIVQYFFRLGNISASRQVFIRWGYEGSWSDWLEIESVQGAQSKVSAHANLTNNPHNVTSSQVNVRDTGWAADTPYDQLPKGITVTQIPSSSGYPLANGTLITNNISQFRCNQILFSHSQQTSTRMFFRIYHQDSGWSGWAEIENTQSAQQKADQAEQNAKDASLPRTGGTVTGTVNIEEGDPSPLKIKRTDSNANISIEYQLDGMSRFLGFDENGDLKVGDSQNLTGSGQFIVTENGDYTNLRARATTKTDVGLGNVENYGIATQAEAQAGDVSNKYMTPLRDRQAFDQHIRSTTISSAWDSSVVRSLGSKGSDGIVHYILLCRMGIFSKTTGVISGTRATSGNNANGLFLVEASHSTSSNSSAQVIALQSQVSGISLVTLTHNGQDYIALRFNRTQFQEYNTFLFRGEATHLNLIKLVEESEVSNVANYNGGNARDVTILGSNGLSINGKLSENIVQQGSNANGYFIRYDSGFQVCWGNPFSLSTDIIINANDPNLYRSESTYWTYPALFNDDYPVTVVGSFSAINRVVGTTGPTSGGGVFVRGYYFGRNPSESAFAVRVIAIGRWK